MIKSKQDFYDYIIYENCNMPHIYALFNLNQSIIKLFLYWLRYCEYLTNSDDIAFRRLRLLIAKYKLRQLRIKNSFTIALNCADKGLRLPHYGGITINGQAVIGKNCCIRPYTVIGNKSSGTNVGAPHIGDNCDIGCNVSIIGNISIGDNVTIGAGSVVIKDVPSNCTVVGNPGRVLPRAQF